MSIYEKITAGEYTPKLPYPGKEHKPPLLSKSAGDLSADDIAALPSVREAWAAAQEAVRFGRAAHNDELRDLQKKFQRDLEKDSGMTGHPKADALFAKAWERGHSGGYGEIYGEYLDLVELVQ